MGCGGDAWSGCSRSAQSYLHRGDAALQRGELAAAVLEYSNAVGRDPLLVAAHERLAGAYLRQGDGAGALAEAVRVADLLPGDAAAQVRAGTLLGLAHRFEDARGRADRALALDPRSVDALVLRANAIASLTDLDGALEQMQQALSLDPRPSLQQNLGVMQVARGHLPEAEAAFRQALAIDPNSVDARLAWGSSCGMPDA